MHHSNQITILLSFIISSPRSEIDKFICITRMKNQEPKKLCGQVSNSSHDDVSFGVGCKEMFILTVKISYWIFMGPLTNAFKAISCLEPIKNLTISLNQSKTSIFHCSKKHLESLVKVLQIFIPPLCHDLHQKFKIQTHNPESGY